MLKNKKMQSGFTLVELMVAIGILAILAAMAYPTYQNFIIRGRIESARSEIIDNIRMMETYYAQNRTMCKTTHSTNGSCLTMPDPVSRPDADTYNTLISRDAFSGSNANNYVIVSLPEDGVYSSSTLQNKEVYLLYYSNGSGYVKCTASGYNAALTATEGEQAGSGCSMM